MRVPLTQAQALRSARLKCFIGKNGELIPDEVLVFSENVFNNQHYERVKVNVKRGTQSPNDRNSVDVCVGFDLGDRNTEEIDIGDNRAAGHDDRRAVSIARRRIRDKILADRRFDTFVTLTLSPDMFDDRGDYGEVVGKMRCWLDNRVRRNGLIYVLVPERHKKTNGIHFHGFVNSDAVKLVDSGLSKDERGNFRHDVEPNRKGKVIYNVADWKYGFTTGVIIGDDDIDQLKSASYVLKYVTKDSEKIGGRWALSGGDIRRPVYFFSDMDINDRDLGDAEIYDVTRNTCFALLRGTKIPPNLVDRFTSVNRV